MAGPNLKGLPQLSSINQDDPARIATLNSPTATQKPKLLAVYFLPQQASSCRNGGTGDSSVSFQLGNRITDRRTCWEGK
jgi:hypothetical protein